MAGGFDWSSLAGSGGGGGGGGMGGMSSMMSSGAKQSQAIYDSLTAAKKAARRRVLQTAPEVLDVGSSIRPVASSPGGSAMAGAAMGELWGAQDSFGRAGMASLDRRIRDRSGRIALTQSSVALAKRVAELAAGAYGAGAAGGATTGGGGFSGVSTTPGATEGGGFSGLDAGYDAGNGVSGAGPVEQSGFDWSKATDYVQNNIGGGGGGSSVSRYGTADDEERRRARYGLPTSRYF